MLPLHKEELSNAFPLAFRLSASEPVRIECGPGWLSILRTLCLLLSEYNERAEGQKIHLSRVVEKFGSIRVLMTGALPEAAAWASFALYLSMQTCEVCGAPGRIWSTDGWQRTRCEEHHASPC